MGPADTNSVLNVPSLNANQHAYHILERAGTLFIVIPRLHLYHTFQGRKRSKEGKKKKSENRREQRKGRERKREGRAKDGGKKKTGVRTAQRAELICRAAGIYTSHIHWVARGTGKPKDSDEVNRREVCECDG